MQTPTYKKTIPVTLHRPRTPRSQSTINNNAPTACHVAPNDFLQLSSFFNPGACLQLWFLFGLLASWLASQGNVTWELALLAAMTLLSFLQAGAYQVSFQNPFPYKEADQQANRRWHQQGRLLCYPNNGGKHNHTFVAIQTTVITIPCRDIALSGTIINPASRKTVTSNNHWSHAFNLPNASQNLLPLAPLWF